MRSLLTAFAGLLCASTTDGAPKRLLLVGQGPDGHPVQTHEYTDWNADSPKFIEA